MIDNGRHNILGVRINALDYEAGVAKVIDAAKADAPFAVTALAVHGVMTGVLDAEHRFRLNKLDMIVPDGQPVRWALNWMHKAKLPDRVYGPNLMLKVCEAAAAEGLPIFLFGGTQDMLDGLVANLTEKFPGIRFAGTRASLFRQLTSEEKQEVIEEIRASGAKITFVGIGCPRQEVWAYEFRDDLSMPLLAVGAAFAFHAGTLAQAPSFMQDYGLEWFYRLCREPKRLWQRYLYLNPLYCSLLLMQRLGLRNFDPDNCPAPTSEMLYG